MVEFESPSIGNGASAPLMLAALIGCIPAFQYGFAIGALNPLTGVVSQALECSPTAFGDWPLIVSVFCPAGFAGTLVASYLSDHLGRAGVITFTAILCVACGLLSGVAAADAASGSPGRAFWLLFLSRCAVGLAAGIGSVTVPSYLGEISPPHLQGLFGVFFQLAVVTGIFFAGLAALPLTTPDGWGVLLSLPAVVGACQLLCMKLVLESPVWLDLKGRPEEASASRRALGLTRGFNEKESEEEDEEAASRESLLVPPAAHDDTEEEKEDHGEEDIDRTAAAAVAGASFTSKSVDHLGLEDHLSAVAPTTTSGGGGKGGAKGFSEMWGAEGGRYRLPLAVLVVLLVGQQLSGINAVFFYSTDFFAAAGLENPVMGTLLASGVNAVATLAVLPLIDRAGRRPLLLWGVAGMGLSCAAITVAMLGLRPPGEALEEPAAAGTAAAAAAAAMATVEAAESTTTFKLLSFVAVGGVLSFVSFFELGLGAIPWLIGSELFPPDAKDAAVGFASACNWFANFAVGLCFPSVNEALGAYSFLPFGAMLAVTFAVTHVLLPETRGRTPREVIELIHVRRRSLCIGSDFKEHT